MNNHTNVFYISVDVETSGPNPSQYSLLSIGACTIFEPITTFYVKLKPVSERYQESAMMINRLSFERLKENGEPPEKAMAKFDAWVHDVVPHGKQAVFVAFNAPFDWMFVADYFYRYLGRNPFGYKALDIKALYMGLKGVPWRQTSMKQLSEIYLGNNHLTHHALQDALDQAVIFKQILEEVQKK